MKPKASKTIRVTVNGEPQEIDDGATVADLVSSMDLAPVRVAVEINEELVPRRTFQDAFIHAGDRIEIVTFVGGG